MDALDEASARPERKTGELGPPRRRVCTPQRGRGTALAGELERDHLAARIAASLERICIDRACVEIVGMIQDLPEQRRFPLRCHATSVL